MIASSWSNLATAAVVWITVAHAAVAQGDAATRGTESRPITDPALVGKWQGSWHLIQPVQIEIRPNGQFTFGTDKGPLALEICHTDDGRWIVESSSGDSLEGTYGVDGNRLIWRGRWQVLSEMRRVPPVLPNGSSTRAPKASECIASLSSTDAGVRVASAGRLAWIAADEPSAVAQAIPALLQRLQDPSSEVRAAAVRALGTAGEPARVTGSALKGLLQDEDPTVRRSVLWALERLVEPVTVLLPTFAGALEDQNPQVRKAAGRALGRMGKAASPAAVALARAVSDPETGSVAQRVLKDLGAKVAADATLELVEVLRSPSLEARHRAAAILVWLGPEARSGVPGLTRHVQDAAALEGGRINAAILLGGLGKDAHSAVPALAAVAQDAAEPQGLRAAAERAVGQIRRAKK